MEKSDVALECRLTKRIFEILIFNLRLLRLESTYLVAEHGARVVPTIKPFRYLDQKNESEKTLKVD